MRITRGASAALRSLARDFEAELVDDPRSTEAGAGRRGP